MPEILKFHLVNFWTSWKRNENLSKAWNWSLVTCDQYLSEKMKWQFGTKSINLWRLRFYLFSTEVNHPTPANSDSHPCISPPFGGHEWSCFHSCFASFPPLHHPTPASAHPCISPPLGEQIVACIHVQLFSKLVTIRRFGYSTINQRWLHNRKAICSQIAEWIQTRKKALARSPSKFENYCVEPRKCKFIPAWTLRLSCVS